MFACHQARMELTLYSESHTVEAKDISSISSNVEQQSAALLVEHTYPDGGPKAWLTVFGAALMLFCCGQLTAFGVFETYYAQHQLKGMSPSTISWIGSLQLWILYFSVRLSDNLHSVLQC